MAHGVMDDNLDTPATIAEVTVQEKLIVQPQGLTEDSSGDSFNQFIPSNGQGIPMTVASDFQYFALVLSRPKRAQEFALINLRPPSILNMNSSLTKAPPQAEEFFQVFEDNRHVQQVLAEYGFAARRCSQ